MRLCRPDYASTIRSSVDPPALCWHNLCDLRASSPVSQATALGRRRNLVPSVAPCHPQTLWPERPPLLSTIYLLLLYLLQPLPGHHLLPPFHLSTLLYHGPRPHAH